MMAVTASSAGPLDDVRHADAQARAALAEAVARSAKLWRGVAESLAPVPGLSWTIGQTAAHVVGDMREYTEALTRHASGDPGVPNVPEGSFARARTTVNGRHLIAVTERDPHRLADLLEETAERYLAAASAFDPFEGVDILTADGLVLEPSMMTCLLLGEQLVHGLDIARAGGRRWTISRDDALLVVPAQLALAPKYLIPTRTKNLRISFELRIRGGHRYRMAITNGAGEVTMAGQKADCVISADPTTFLLLGFARVPQWPQIIRGKLRAGGRKPWHAAKFAALLASP